MGDEMVPLEPGAQCGRYRIEKEIGRGGMGVVYLARNERGDARAIKTLVFGGKLTEQLTERFRREILLLASIEHVHMVRFYEAGKIERPEGTTMWIALEHLEGRTLREIIDEQGAVEPENVARWCLHIALGVAAAHKLHVVHRDLKPENAALSGEIVKVFDLGIAKWQGAANATAANLRIGTLAYMAPEQVDPSVGSIEAHTDVYALGLILHELATGRHPICPFDEPLPPTEVQLRIVGMDPPSLSALLPGFPEDLAQIGSRCLQKDPSARFASMREVADALDEVLTRLRTERHSAALADLGVDAGAAHAAVRKAKTSSGTDATPPPVVQDPSSAGGYTPNQPRTARMDVGEEQIQAWAAQAKAKRQARAQPGGVAQATEIAEPGSLSGAAAVGTATEVAAPGSLPGSVATGPLPAGAQSGASGVSAASADGGYPAAPATGGATGTTAHTGRRRSWALPLVIAVAAVLGVGTVVGRHMLFGPEGASEPAAGAEEGSDEIAGDGEAPPEAEAEAEPEAPEPSKQETAESAAEETDLPPEDAAADEVAADSTSVPEGPPPAAAPAPPPPRWKPQPKSQPKSQPKPTPKDVILIE